MNRTYYILIPEKVPQLHVQPTISDFSLEITKKLVDELKRHARERKAKR